MASEEEIIQTKFHAFLQQRNSKGNATMQEAQKLVNLYRLLSFLGENFVDEYNAMLLNVSDEVLMTLNAIVGGQEVRQYFDFLTQDKRKEEMSDESETLSQNKGWLPSPQRKRIKEEEIMFLLRNGMPLLKQKKKKSVNLLRS